MRCRENRTVNYYRVARKKVITPQSANFYKFWQQSNLKGFKKNSDLPCFLCNIPLLVSSGWMPIRLRGPWKRTRR
jgi:hypothetical protein